MAGSALRIRDLQLQLTQHRRNLHDGSVKTDEQVRAERRHFSGACGGADGEERKPEMEGVSRYDDDAEQLVRRHFMIQCRFVTPVRSVSALSVKATDRDTMYQIKQKLLEQLHELPEPRRPPDHVIASCGSRYYQRQSVVNSFRANIATNPRQLLFFVDEDDESLPDRATLFELGYDSPPLISVYCATDHLWLRLRGYPDRYSVPWHLHMTEVELAKEVYGLLKPEDMRLVRAVFYRDQEHMRRNRTWRRPATEAPPTWNNSSNTQFGAFETEETFFAGNSSVESNSNNKNNNNHMSKRTTAATATATPLVLEPVVIPLHEWCRMPLPPPTRVNPALVFEDLRRQVALTRSDMVREAFAQASDSWYTLPPDVQRMADSVDNAVQYVPKCMQFTRTRDGRRYVFRAEVTTARDGDVQQNTSQHVGSLAQAVLDHCKKSRPLDRQQQQQQQQSNHDSDPRARRNSPEGQAAHALAPTTNQRVESGGDDANNDAAAAEQDRDRFCNMNLEYQVELLSWEPEMVRTGHVLDNGEEELVPKTQPQLHLPFDDDDEQLSPFGRKEIHEQWQPADMVSKYPFLQSDFFFHQRRADVGLDVIVQTLRRDVKSFFDETLCFSFNRPEPAHGLYQKDDVVEFDNVSLPRHLSDYGIANGCEVFVEFFSVHTQRWSNDICQEAHTRMRELSDVQLQHDRMVRLKAAAAMSSSSTASPEAIRRELQALGIGKKRRGTLTTPTTEKTPPLAEIPLSSLELSETPLRGRITRQSHMQQQQQQNRSASSSSSSSATAMLRRQKKEQADSILLGGTDVIEKKTTIRSNPQFPSIGIGAGSSLVSSIGFSSLSQQQRQNRDDEEQDEDYEEEDDDDDDENANGNVSDIVKMISAAVTAQQQPHQQETKKRSVLRKKKTLPNELQLSKRRREAEVRAAGFSIINVRTYRNVLLRVPVIFESATVQDVLELVHCATGDVPMFSAVLSPQGVLMSPWTQLREVEERNPGLLHLRILRRPRPWCGETLETVARATRRTAPHLD